jgi:hypothetical protein
MRERLVVGKTSQGGITLNPTPNSDDVELATAKPTGISPASRPDLQE